MNLEASKQPGKLATYTAAFIILAIAILGNFYPELFVAQSGSFQLFGNLGILLAIGLVRKWKHIRAILSVWTFVIMVGLLMGLMVSKSIATSYLALLLTLAIVFYLTTFSSSVKMYLSES